MNKVSPFKVRFIGLVLSGHKQAAVEVPFDPSIRWSARAVAIGPRRRGHRVQGTFAGVAFQSVVVARSKRFWVLIERAHLDAAGVSLGDSVEISLEPLA